MYSRAVQIPFRVRSHGFNEKMRQVACVKTKYILADKAKTGKESYFCSVLFLSPN